MTCDEMVQAIERDRADLAAALEGLDDPTMTTRPVVEQWTVKDLLGHMAMWHQVALKFIADYRATGVPQPLGFDNDAIVDAHNAREAARRHDWSLAQVCEELDASHRDLVAAVKSLGDADLGKPLPAPWQNGATLEYLIAINSYTHDPDHIAQIRRLR